MPGPLAVPIDAALVLALLREQFPQWADHPVTPADLDGWDNRTFRVGDAAQCWKCGTPRWAHRSPGRRCGCTVT